jgi:hypothetical protein
MSNSSDSINSEIKPRGTHDDLEVLKMIIEEHPGLKKRILDKIRIQRSLSGRSSETQLGASEKGSEK